MAAYQLLFAGALALVGAAALRLSARSIESLAARVIAAVPIGLAFVVTESLVFGLAGLGGSAWALSAGALVFWVGVRLAVAAPARSIHDQVGDWWRSASLWQRAATGASVTATGAELAVQLWRPILGGDGLNYHAAQPVLWVQDGHPGSMHATLADFPTQAYPRTLEVLISWAYAIGRNPLSGTVFMVGIAVLCIAAVVVLLRELGAGWLLAIGGAGGCLLLPLNAGELSGVYSDLPALGLLATTGALCAMARREPGVLGAALLSAGLAIGIKPTALPLAVVALVWAGSSQWSRVRAGCRGLLLPGAISLGLAAVWYIADWVSFGSPLWPFSRFPNGRPVPFVWQMYGARFLHVPRQTYDLVGGSTYVHYLAGGLIVLAGAVVIALLALTAIGRVRRRIALFGLLALLLEVFLWADSEFTGVAHGNPTLVITGLRYLTPAPVVAVVVLVVASRDSPVLQRLSELVGLAALALNLWELRFAVFSFPIRPELAVWVALALVGALVAAVADGRRRLVWTFASPVAALAATAGLGVALTVATSSYLDNYLAAGQIHGYPDRSILEYLRSQPKWTSGSAPVAIGSVSFSTLAGPHFQHSESLVTANESCARVHAAARRGWLILQPLEHEPFPEFDFTAPVQCMSGVQPAAVVAGGWQIYPPGS
jgi:hypothetical protein